MSFSLQRDASHLVHYGDPQTYTKNKPMTKVYLYFMPANFVPEVLNVCPVSMAMPVQGTTASNNGVLW